MLYLLNDDYTQRMLKGLAKCQIRLFELLINKKVEQAKEYDWLTVYPTIMLLKIMGVAKYDGKIYSGMQWEQLLDSGIRYVKWNTYKKIQCTPL